MEFNEKLQELRKKRKLTQEEVAERLFVSRTAVSKWESGRGYPSIDSLKRIAELFSVTVDELLSSSELLTLAQEEAGQKKARFRDLSFGLLDILAFLFFFLPLFAERSEGAISAVSLLALTAISPYLRLFYFVIITAIVAWGVLTLALQNCECAVWLQIKSKISVVLNVIGVLLFVLSLQPYAATFLFVLLAIKALISLKK